MPRKAIWPWLILAHRYLGSALGVLFAVWFASGIAMIYVSGMPSIAAEERLRHLEPLALDRVLLTSAEAASRSRVGGDIDRPRLFTILGRPVYRLVGTETVNVFADNGERALSTDDDTALKIAAFFVSEPRDRLSFEERLTVADQWTLGQRRQMPLRKFAANDSAGTEVYVSEPLAEVVMKTTRRSRLLAWFGPIPHWIYFAPLRRRDDVWRQVVLWTSGAGAVLVLLGLAIGVRQWSVPYVGWLKWHQTTGLVFGLFALTWVFSGWLSMEPGSWASADRALSSAIARELQGPSTASVAADRSMLVQLAGANVAAKEIEWTRILGKPFCIVRSDTSTVLVDAATMETRTEPFPLQAIVDSVERAGRAKVISSALLTEPDTYYYQRDAVFPILKIALDDGPRSSVYVDPKTAQLMSIVNRRDRLERWVYHGLHSLDFSFWYRRRPLWDAGVIALCTGGLVLSGLGLILAGRRMRRALGRG